MSILSELHYVPGAIRGPKRIGRGDGSGRGGTSTKGHKGQKARSGGTVRRGFEGGQMPLHRRIPKMGFNNIFRKVFAIVNVEEISKLDGEVNPETLAKIGLVSLGMKVKILGHGELTKKLVVKAHAFSESAIKKIESRGGKIEVLK